MPCLACFIVELGSTVGLGGVGTLPYALVLLAAPTLVVFVLLGRRRLPPEEFVDTPHFADHVASARSCVGEHLYVRRGDVELQGRSQPVRIASARTNRGISGSGAALSLESFGLFLLVTPRSYWLVVDGQVVHGEVTGIGVDIVDRDLAVLEPREDDKILGSRWQHATKRGERDYRYKQNLEIWDVRRYAVELALCDYRWGINAYSYPAACQLANAFLGISGSRLSYVADSEPDDEDADPDDDESADDDDAAEEPPTLWYEVLGVAHDASKAAIKSAYRERMMEYHPDRCAHLGEKLRALAEEEAAAINWAYLEGLNARP